LRADTGLTSNRNEGRRSPDSTKIQHTNLLGEFSNVLEERKSPAGDCEDEQQEVLNRAHMRRGHRPATLSAQNVVTDWTTIASTTIVRMATAQVAGNAKEAAAKMREAATIEHSMDTLSQPPYPIIPAPRTFRHYAEGFRAAWRSEGTMPAGSEADSRTPKGQVAMPRVSWICCRSAIPIGPNWRTKKRGEGVLDKDRAKNNSSPI
jgi:hypothetical protein